jgi:hypothetical protein
VRQDRNRDCENLQRATRYFKRRGVKLGKTGKQRAKENKAAADAHAKALGPTIRELCAAGITSVRAIAAELNDRKVPTVRGGEWHATSVARLLARLG